MDWAEWRRRREEAPAEARVPLCADGEGLRLLEEARVSRDPDVRARVPELQERVAAATMHVTLRALPADDYQALKDAHKPSDPEKLKKGYEWEEATFAPALLAASIVDPPLTADEAKDLWSDSGPGAPSLAERATLFLTARDLNETVPDLGFTKPGTE